MVFTQNPIATRVKVPQCALANIANASGTGQVTLVTAGANGSKVTGINLASTDGTLRNVQISISNGSVNFLLGTVPVPITAGNDGVTPAVQAFNSSLIPGLPIDNDGQPYLFVPASNTIQIKATTATGSGNLIFAICTYADF